MKKLLAVLFIVAMLFVFVPNSMACHGPNCNQYTANASSTSILDGTQIWSDPSNAYAGGASIADATLSAQANAKGKDYTSIGIEWKWVKIGRHWVKLPVPVIEHHKGYALADVKTFMEQKGYVCVLTNGPQAEGLAFTFVKSTALLFFDASAFAKGTGRCPEYATVNLTGELTAYAYGNATVDGLYGNQAWAGGEGLTTVSFEGSDSEYDHNGSIADADLKGIVGVNQNLVATAYVNPNGTLTKTFALIHTGNAFEFGDAHITGINSSGMVSQSSYATNGLGAIAAGMSQAAYNNVANGLAMVNGFNMVTQTANSLTVMSSHSAYAGGVGGMVHPN